MLRRTLATDAIWRFNEQDRILWDLSGFNAFDEISELSVADIFSGKGGFAAINRYRFVENVTEFRRVPASGFDLSAFGITLFLRQSREAGVGESNALLT